MKANVVRNAQGKDKLSKKNMLRNLILMFITGTIFFSCKNYRSLSLNEMRAYIEDEKNGLIQEAERNEIKFSIKYKPVDAAVAQELYNTQISQQELDHVKERYSNLEYFTLNISSDKKKLGDMIKFDEKKGRQDSIASYVHFYMQKDFRIINGKDTSACVLYHLEQNGNISPFISISLAFEKTKSNESEIKLIYHDKIFNTGNLIFTFLKEDIQNTPALKLKS